MDNLDYVRLDVGHYLYTCHSNTLKKYPDSFLAKLVSPEFDKRKTNQEYIIVDRDGKHFGTILNYLRDQDSLDLSNFSDVEIGQISREADFYGLTQLKEFCDDWIETNSHINLKDRGISRRLELIFGYEAMISVLELTKKPTLVLNVDEFFGLNFFDSMELIVAFCSRNKIPVYGFKKMEEEKLSNRDMNLQSIMTIFEQGPKIRRKFDISKFDDQKKLFKSMLNFMISVDEVEGPLKPQTQGLPDTSMILG